LAFVGAGSVCLYACGEVIHEYVASGSWDRVPATITAVYVGRENQPSDGKFRDIMATYSYRYASSRESTGEYEASATISLTESRHRQRRELLHQHQKSGEPLVAWINPRNPQKVLLFREMDYVVFGGAFGFGMFFSIAGAGLIIASFCLLRAVLRHRRAPAPDLPWRSDHRWASGFEFRSTVPSTAALYSSMGFLLLGFPFPLLALAVDSGWGMIIVALMWAGGLWTIVHSVFMVLRLLRFGSVRLVLDEVPAIPGRAVRGAVRCSRRVFARGDYRITLKCERSTGSDVGSPEKVFEGGQECPAEKIRPGNDRGAEIPLAIQIPKDSLPTAARATQPITWTLTVRVPARFVDFQAEFNLPVFRVEYERLVERRPEGAGA
jgi:hypothetical protein